MIHQNSLDTQVFRDSLDFKTLENILETLDHITVKKVSRADFNKLQGNFLQEDGEDKFGKKSILYKSVYYNKLQGNFLQENLEDKFGKKYILYLPEDLVYGELLQIINFLTQKFGLESYTGYGRLITQTKVMIGVVLRGLGNEDGEEYLQKLADKYSLTPEFIKKFKPQKEGGDRIIFSEAKKIIKATKSKRTEKSNKKIGEDQKDIVLGSEKLKDTYQEELNLTLFRRGTNLLRYGMRTITEAEQQYIRQNKNNGDIVSFHVPDEELDEEERLLRDKIGIDDLKRQLKEAKNSGDSEKIQEAELKATNAIIKVLYEYPYQMTSNDFGYQPNKIAEFKEIYCVGFSILGHAFLSELGIKHNSLNALGHSPLEVIIGGKKYYFDATAIDQILEFNYGEQVGIYSKIDLVKGKFGEEVYAYSGPPEKILLSQIYFNKGFALNKLGKHEEAITMYEEALKLNSDDSDVCNNMGASLYNLQRYNEAINMYNKSFYLNPNNVNIYYNIGEVLDKLGKYYISSLYMYVYYLLNKSLVFELDKYEEEKAKLKKLVEEEDFDGIRKYLLEIESSE